MCNDREMMVNVKPGEYTRKMFFFLQSVTQAAWKKKNPSTPNRSQTCDLLSYRRLVGAKATKVGSCDKHPAAYSHDQDVDMCLYRCNDRNVMMNFELGECMREVFFQSVTQVAWNKKPEYSK